MKVFLQNPDSRPQSDNILSAIGWTYVILPAYDIFRGFFSKATLIFSSQGTVSSISRTCFVIIDQRIKSGRRVVVAICSGTFNRFPMSTFICQSREVDSRQMLGLHAEWGDLPALAQQIDFASGLNLPARIAVSTLSATVLSTWSYRQRYIPSSSALSLALIMCLSEPFPTQSTEDRVPIFHHVNKLAGLDSASHTD